MRSVRFLHYIAIPNLFDDLFFVSQPYYVKSTHSLLMTSSASRSQAANVDDVLSKVCIQFGSTLFVAILFKRSPFQLHSLVAESAAGLITKSPTREQRERVASLQKAEDSRRRVQKDKRSAAKTSRSKKDWD